MKVGNLICFNSAGQKNKTLGLILEKSKKWMDVKEMLLIYWCITGDVMPRIEYSMHSSYEWGDKPKPGKPCWHQRGEWFEVVDEEG